jgi:hypothetical protein
MDTPATYRICVLGGLESSYAERFWGMTSTPVEAVGEPEQTALLGEVLDQAALVGVINALYNAGYTVLSVERVLPESDLHLEDTKKDNFTGT